MILIDSNIFMYASGAPHRNKVPSVNILHSIARLEFSACVNAEILQEILHRYRAIDRWDEGREVYSLARKIIPVVEPVTAEIIEKAAGLMDLYPGLMVRDCVHAAHCILAGLEGICSFDSDFDEIEGVRRIAPLATAL